MPSPRAVRCARQAVRAGAISAHWASVRSVRHGRNVAWPQFDSIHRDYGASRHDLNHLIRHNSGMKRPVRSGPPPMPTAVPASRDHVTSPGAQVRPDIAWETYCVHGQVRAAGPARVVSALARTGWGRGVEIGAGTGNNLEHYPPAVTALTVTEPEPAMVRGLERHVADHAPFASVLCAPAEDLPFEDGSFDVAVSTLVLRGVEHQQRALRQLARCCDPAAGCCSSNTSGPMVRDRPASRAASIG